MLEIWGGLTPFEIPEICGEKAPAVAPPLGEGAPGELPEAGNKSDTRLTTDLPPGYHRGGGENTVR